MNIFVAGFPISFGKKELGELFEKYGIVKSVKVILDRDTGVSRSFGFVDMPEETEAKEAIKNLHYEIIENNNLTVKEARDQK